MDTIAQIVYAYMRDPATPPPESLITALTQREDEIADSLRMAGMNLGAEPAFVNKAILDIGIGTRPADDEVDLINRTFAERVAYWQDQIRRQSDGG